MAERPKFFDRNRVADWVGGRRRAGKMLTEDASLGDIPPWQFSTENNVQHRLRNLDSDGTPRFMEIVARKILPRGAAEGAFNQPGIAEVVDTSDPNRAAGTVGLLVDRKTGKLLLQTASEPLAASPGQPASEYVTIRPSLQGSYTNIKEHKIKFSDQVDVSHYTNLVQVNPSRIEGKIRVGITYVDGSKIDLGNNPDYKWFSRKEIRQAIKENVEFNGFLMAALSVYDARKSFWNRFSLFGAKAKEAQHTVTQRAFQKRAQFSTGALDSLSLPKWRANLAH